MRGEEYKPMSVTERRRLKSKNNSTSDAETSESTSESGKCSPIPSTSYAVPATPPPQVDCKVGELRTSLTIVFIKYVLDDPFFSIIWYAS